LTACTSDKYELRERSWCPTLAKPVRKLLTFACPAPLMGRLMVIEPRANRVSGPRIPKIINTTTAPRKKKGGG